MRGAAVIRVPLPSGCQHPLRDPDGRTSAIAEDAAGCAIYMAMRRAERHGP